MVKDLSKQNGTALAMTLMALALMVILVLTMNKLGASYAKSISNSSDYDLAQNYAKSAMLAAEATVLTFDNNAGLQNPAGGGTLVARRYAILSQTSGTYNVESSGATCNMSAGGVRQGWCYQSAGVGSDFAQNTNFFPWTLTAANLTAPCNSYTASSGNLPILDDKTNRLGITFNTNDSSLCVQPRYIIEPISLNYVGGGANIIQGNGATLVIDTLQSARIYRITVRAFGRNGDTRVTLQEYVAIYTATGVNASSNIIPLSMHWLRPE